MVAEGRRHVGMDVDRDVRVGRELEGLASTLIGAAAEHLSKDALEVALASGCHSFVLGLASSESSASDGAQAGAGDTERGDESGVWLPRTRVGVDVSECVAAQGSQQPAQRSTYTSTNCSVKRLLTHIASGLLARLVVAATVSHLPTTDWAKLHIAARLMELALGDTTVVTGMLATPGIAQLTTVGNPQVIGWAPSAWLDGCDGLLGYSLNGMERLSHLSSSWGRWLWAFRLIILLGM